MTRKYIVAALAAGLSAALAAPALAQTPAKKPLVQQWLDGELPYTGPKITYSGAPITVRFSSFIAPTGSIATEIWKQAFERLAKETNGKLIVRPYWANSLADAQRGAFEAVSSGTATMSHCYSTFNPGGFDLELGIQMPFLIKRATVSAQTFQEIYPKYLRGKYEEKGVYLARAATTPPNQLLTRNKPIRKIEDLAGLKTWALGEFPTRVVSALGGVPIALPPSELYVSFQSGVMDVAAMHDAGTKLFRLGELTKYRTVANLMVTPTEYCMNRKFFDELPADLKAAFYIWLQKFNHAEAELYYEADAKRSRDEMKAKGTESIELTEAELAPWRAKTEPVVDAWIAAQEAKGLPVKQFVADFKAKYAEIEKLSDDDIFARIMKQPTEGLVSSYTLPK